MTPEEMRVQLQGNTVALLAASNAAKGVDDTAAKAEEKKKEDEKTAKRGAAIETAHSLSEKCMKAAGALSDHVTKSENDDNFGPEHKSAVVKAHKAVKAAHVALGGGKDAEEGDDDGTAKTLTADTFKAEMADAIKAAMAPLQAEIQKLQDKSLSPRGAGPGGVAATAAKGAGVHVGDVVVGTAATKSVADMTPAERQDAAFKAYNRSRAYPIPADEFGRTGNEVLKAIDNQLQEIQGQKKAVAQV